MESYFEFKAPNIYNKTETDNLLTSKVDKTYGILDKTLTINGNLDSTTKCPLYVQNASQHNEFWTVANFYQQIENSGSWIQFSRNCLTDLTWQTGMDFNLLIEIRRELAS